MELDDKVWGFFQEHLGYSDEELDMFRKDPKNAEILSRAAELMNKTIVAEVVESRGCNSQHKVGDRFVFDGAGNLLTKLNPERICVHAMSAFSPCVYVANELFYAGVDPNETRFKRVGCFDVGVRCGGWGHIVMELKVEDRQVQTD
jgi:uncharacterized repeat protein (TIGR04076 family)